MVQQQRNPLSHQGVGHRATPYETPKDKEQLGTHNVQGKQQSNKQKQNLLKCNCAPEAITDAKFQEGLVAVDNTHCFHIPVFKNFNYGSPTLQEGQRVGFLTPFDCSGDNSLEVQKLRPTRKVSWPLAQVMLKFRLS